MERRIRGTVKVLAPACSVRLLREWLNDPGSGGTAMVYARVEQDAKWDAELELKIADCFRSVSLDLSLSDATARRNTLTKLEILEKAVRFLSEAAYEVAIAVASRERRRRNEARKRLDAPEEKSPN